MGSGSEAGVRECREVAGTRRGREDAGFHT
jgi:hypothetical protein